MREWKKLATLTGWMVLAALLTSLTATADDIIRTKRGHKYVGDIQKVTADVVEIEIVVQGIPFVIPIQQSDVEGIDWDDEGITGADGQTAPTPEPEDEEMAAPDDPTPLPPPGEEEGEPEPVVEPTATPTPQPAPTDTPTPVPDDTEEEEPLTARGDGLEWEGPSLRAREIFQSIVQTEDAKQRITDVLIPLLPPALPLGEYLEVTATNLNIRGGPSTDFEKIGAAQRGTIVRMQEEGDGWYRVTTPEGLTGWVHGRFARPLEEVKVVITGTNVNFREEPTTRALAMRKFDQGEIAVMLKGAKHAPKPDNSVLEPGDFWMQLVDVHGNIGWMAAQFAARVISDGILTPPLNEDPAVTAEGRLQAESVDAGPGHRQQWRLVVTDEKLVRRGRIGLVALYSGMIETDAERLGLLTAPDEDDLIWRGAYEADELEQLGFEPRLLEAWEGGVLAYIKGRKESEGWVFEVAVEDEAAMAAPEQPLEFNYALVVQEGEERGTLIPFYAPGRM